MRTVWYLAHPVNGDDEYTNEGNMKHIIELMQFFLENDVYVVAPYYAQCVAFPESNDERREQGLAIDCVTVQKLGALMLTGHKVSTGMRVELDALLSISPYALVNLTGLSKAEIKRLYIETGKLQ